MSDDLLLFDPPADGGEDTLATYAQRAYLEYALSVVKGRALPDVCDGQKPVQRRILYAMQRMGLGHGSSGAPKPVKSARVVGDVLGRFHPHGDQAAYDALVRMAQDFSQRYPLIDGQGNFGSRDGDGAAAMRYTEARLAKITTLLLDEIDEGTVDFIANYDGSTEEPRQLPARLPFTLLNGASGIAVGMATEIPSHNLREVADACVALIKNPKLSDDELLVHLPAPDYPGGTEEPRQLPARLPFTLLNGASGIAVGMATEIPSHNLREVADACVALIKNPKLSDDELLVHLPAPDYPGGGQIISAASDIAQAYKTGRGSLKVRARWVIEDLARGQWQLVVNELPPGVSTQRVLEEIEEITNPKVKAGKKALSAEQTQLKASMLAVLDVVRDESGKEAAVRLVFEPKTRTISQAELITQLLAHTSLETSSSINLTMVGIDGKPVPKSLRGMLTEWISFRQDTIVKRSQNRLSKVLDRIHILEGRQLVLLNIDEVIAIIRQSDEPKEALIARFKLSERQAEDILEIRLRQLARLEAIKIEQELSKLREDQVKLEDILNNPNSLKRLMVKEIEADAKAFGDERRTLVQAEKRAVAEIKVIDEPVTVVVSDKGWVRTRTGHGHAADAFAFKAGDTLRGTFECRTIDTLIVLGSNGRTYSLPVSALPGGRGDGQPITTLIELEPGATAAHYMAGALDAGYLLSSSDGYGFVAQIQDMTSRQKAGKAFVNLAANARVNEPSPLLIHTTTDNGVQPIMATHVACASVDGRVLTFELTELKHMPKGGRGLMLLDLADKDQLAGAAVYTRSVTIAGVGRGGKAREETLEIRSLNNARGVRARKGKAADFGFKPNRVIRVL